MSISGNKIIPAFTLILCLMIPSMLMVSAAVTQASGSVWKISIAGYDPRDLLRGHYLRFRYDWGIAEGKSCPDEVACCLCLSAVSGHGNMDPAARPMACDSPERKSCDAVVDDGLKESWRQQQQYFIPENEAIDLEKMLWDPKQSVHVEVAIPASGGKPAIRGLYINGRPMVDVLHDLAKKENTSENPE